MEENRKGLKSYDPKLRRLQNDAEQQRQRQRERKTLLEDLSNESASYIEAIQPWHIRKTSNKNRLPGAAQASF